MKKFIITLLITFIFSSASFAGERINLAFNIDNNYAAYMLLTINSIFKHNKSDSTYYIYVVENDLSSKNKARIKKFVEKNNHNIEFINITDNQLDVGKSYYYSGLPITNIAFARIYLPELLKDLDKIIYLDSDILVLSDIKDLYNTNISGYAMGLVLDFSYVYRLKTMKEDLEKLLKALKTAKYTRQAKLESIAELRKNIKIEETYPYYNDGIILMDLAYMRKLQLTKKMTDYAAKHPNLLYADQDVINYAARPYIKRIDPKWNNQYYSGSMVTETSNGGIIHYISNIKPWMTLPKKSCPERYAYFQNWFSSEFRFDYINALYKILKKPYIAFCKQAIDNIKLQVGYPDKNKETIYVAFTIDNNYWLYTLLTINSIVKNNQSNSPYHFYVIEDNLTDKNKQKMAKYVKRWHHEIEFIDVDTTIVDGGENLYSKTKQHKHISRIAMARIFLPNLLPKNIKKVIYLDSDLITTKDLKQLYDVDISNYPVAMAKDITEVIDKKQLDNLAKISKTKRSTYYNDGVILMNLDYWRKYKITEQMVNYMKVKKYLPKMDQDLINIMLKGKIKELKPHWNNQYCATNIKSSEDEAYKKGILHYTGADKPWLYYDSYYENPGYECREVYSTYWTRSSLLKYQILPKFTLLKSAYLYFGRICLVNLQMWDFK